MRPRLGTVAALAPAVCAGVSFARGDTPFATRVLDYAPAPGQFVNNSQYNDPSRALGTPGTLAGTAAADNTKVVTLGGFGGSITLGFDHRVFDNPRNPFGIDLVVYGNAFWFGNDPARRWAEAGIVEVSVDANGNGVADDAWYLIPGSALAGSPTPPARTTVAWDDNTADPARPPASPAWIPAGRSGTWTTSGYLLPAAFNGPVLANTGADGGESFFGYADCSPTAVLGDTDGDNVADDPAASPGDFYTRPDDPRRVGLSPGSSGGDGIDLAWAIDEGTGAPAHLPWIDFVRITTAVNAVNPPLGEVSTEVSAVADARAVYTADWNLDGAVTVQDIFDFLADYFGASPAREGGGADFNASGATTVQDIFDFLTAYFAG